MLLDAFEKLRLLLVGRGGDDPHKIPTKPHIGVHLTSMDVEMHEMGYALDSGCPKM